MELDDPRISEFLHDVCWTGLVHGPNGVRGAWAAVHSDHPPHRWGGVRPYQAMLAFRDAKNRPVGVLLRAFSRHAIERKIKRFVARHDCAHNPINHGRILSLVSGARQVPFVDALSDLGIFHSSWLGTNEAGADTTNDIRMAHAFANLPEILYLAFGLDMGFARLVACRHGPLSISAFMETLDPVALEIANAISWSHRRRIKWESIDRTFDPAAPAARLAKQFTAFSNPICEMWLNSPREITDASNVFDILPKLVLDLCNISMHNAILPRIHKVVDRLSSTWPESGHPSLVGVKDHQFVSIMYNLSKLPEDWLPDSSDEWAAMFRAMNVDRLDYWSNSDNPDMSWFFNSKGRWVEFMNRLHRSAGTKSDDELATAVCDVRDMTNAFYNEILYPAGILSGRRHRDCSHRENRGHRLNIGRSLPRILEESRVWHATRTTMLARLSELGPSVSTSGWAGGLPNLRIGDIDIVVLESVGELVAEGSSSVDAAGMAGLNHCVGGYHGACFDGASRIVSLRSVTGGSTRRLSTAQILVKKGKFDLGQHRAYKNGEPSADCANALSEYMLRINSPDFSRDDTAFARRPDTSSGDLAAGYVITEPGAFQLARDIWAPFLPRPMRTWGPEEFADWAFDSVPEGDIPKRRRLLAKLMTAGNA